VGEARPHLQPRRISAPNRLNRVRSETRFFFLHLQKTGGTALWRRLKQQFDPASMYPGPDDGRPPESTISVDHLLERWKARSGEIRIVTGHFPLCTTTLLGGTFTTLTLLRDPIERTLSYLRHHRETDGDERSLEEIYADPVRFELLRNHMVKMLSLRVEEMSEGALTHVDFTPERLDRAKVALQGVDVVGFQEDFETFCAELTDRFGWDLGPPVFMNRTTPVEVADEFRARIAADNADDIALYEFARRHRIASGDQPSRATHGASGDRQRT
jgi:hypothetical protein